MLNPQSVQAALQAIEQHQRILVVPHANVDPDGLSSALAVYQMLKEMGKEVTVICPDVLPETLNFLPGFEKLEREVKASQDFVITINLQDGVEVDKLRYTVEDHKVNIIVVPKKGSLRSQQNSLAEGGWSYDLINARGTHDLAAFRREPDRVGEQIDRDLRQRWHTQCQRAVRCALYR